VGSQRASSCEDSGKKKVGEYLVADTPSAAVALVQMGIVEIHTWNSASDDVEHPNRMIWDLDPGPEIVWKQVVSAARLVRSVLQTLGLASWVKTTGGRGLHVVVPIRPGPDWSECLDYAREVSEALVQTDPSIYTTAFTKHGRERKILIDYLRNNRTNTSICAYSPRARTHAPVSMPVDWRQLMTEPPAWTLRTVPQRLRRQRVDPWEGYWTSSQRVTTAAVTALRRL
jgi:bifunctional non-homologous end joining protein LigD